MTTNGNYLTTTNLFVWQLELCLRMGFCTCFHPWCVSLECERSDLEGPQSPAKRLKRKGRFCLLSIMGIHGSSGVNGPLITDVSPMHGGGPTPLSIWGVHITTRMVLQLVSVFLTPHLLFVKVLWQGDLWCCNFTRRTRGSRSMGSFFMPRRRGLMILVSRVLMELGELCTPFSELVSVYIVDLVLLCCNSFAFELLGIYCLICFKLFTKFWFYFVVTLWLILLIILCFFGDSLVIIVC